VLGMVACRKPQLLGAWGRIAALVTALSAAHALPQLTAAALGLGLDCEQASRRLRAQGGAEVWPGLVLAAMLMKLSASTDDVVWLLPFLLGARKWRNTPVYLACMQLVVAISWGISAAGSAGLQQLVPAEDSSSWPVERVLALVSAVLLTLFTFKLVHEWWFESEEEAEEPEGASEAFLSGDSGPKSEQPAGAWQATSKFNMCRLFTISMIGSLDDIAIFVSLLLSRAFSAWQLSLGVFLGSAVVVWICLAAGRCSCVVRLVEKVPLWCILGVFALWLYISVFALDAH